ncbi:MAG: MurR/RpiR family transcriptional regulator [Coprobacillus sp.]
MLIEEKLKQIKLSSAQEVVANFLRTERANIKEMTIKELADKTYTSTTTIIRLAKKLGFEGFEELKDNYVKEVLYLDTHFSDIDANKPFYRDDNIQRISSKITALAKEALDDTLTLIEHDSLQKAIRIMKDSETIHIAAISYCLLLGQMFKLDMARIGKNVNICDINGEELFMPAVMKQNDCVIFLSYSGQIEKLCQLAKIVKEKGIKIIVVTSLGDNELRKYADVLMHISTREKLYSKIAGYSNEYSIKLILDILYSCYFGTDYEANYEKKIKISQDGEVGRHASLDIMKEDEA